VNGPIRRYKVGGHKIFLPPRGSIATQTTKRGAATELRSCGTILVQVRSSGRSRVIGVEKSSEIILRQGGPLKRARQTREQSERVMVKEPSLLGWASAHPDQNRELGERRTLPPGIDFQIRHKDQGRQGSIDRWERQAEPTRRSVLTLPVELQTSGRPRHVPRRHQR
jgi:hypothetical protein